MFPSIKIPPLLLTSPFFFLRPFIPFHTELLIALCSSPPLLFRRCRLFFNLVGCRHVVETCHCYLLDPFNATSYPVTCRLSRFVVVFRPISPSLDTSVKFLRSFLDFRRPRFSTSRSRPSLASFALTSSSPLRPLRSQCQNVFGPLFVPNLLYFRESFGRNRSRRHALLC